MPRFRTFITRGGSDGAQHPCADIGDEFKDAAEQACVDDGAELTDDAVQAGADIDAEHLQAETPPVPDACVPPEVQPSDMQTGRAGSCLSRPQKRTRSACKWDRIISNPKLHNCPEAA
jgi:hypothetical protein